MNAHVSRITLFVFLFVSFSLVSSAQDKMPPEAYSAVAMGTGGNVGAKTTSFNFQITQYTTDEELQNFAQLVKDKGTDALRRALEKEDKGRISPVSSTGNQIAVARKRQQGSETIITIVTARTMPFVELNRGGRTTDYPFGYLQVKLDATGKGTGQIMAAAKIRFDQKKGQVRNRKLRQPVHQGRQRPHTIVACCSWPIIGIQSKRKPKEAHRWSIHS
jgi:hypothetical protein